MKIKDKEFFELMAQFERDLHFFSMTTNRIDKESNDLWEKGIIYQAGEVNALFKAYQFGYAYRASLAKLDKHSKGNKCTGKVNTKSIINELEDIFKDYGLVVAREKNHFRVYDDYDEIYLSDNEITKRLKKIKFFLKQNKEDAAWDYLWQGDGIKSLIRNCSGSKYGFKPFEVSNKTLLKQLQKAFKNFQDDELFKNPNNTFMVGENIGEDDLLRMALINADCDVHGKSTNRHGIIKTWISIDDETGNTIYDAELQFEEKEFHRDIIDKAMALGFLCKHSISKRDYYFFCDSPNEFLWWEND